MKSIAIALGALILTACGNGSDSEASGDPANAARIHYEVRLRDGGEVPIRIQYKLPSGEMQQERATTPWSGPPMSFAQGQMLISARTKASVESPLLCVLASEEPSQGDYVYAHIDVPLTECETTFEFGTWPPDDSDPIENPLIRVG